MKIRLLLGIIALLVLPATAMGAGSETFPFTGKVNAEHVNIRAGQSENFEALGELQKGETVVVVQKNYSWYKIKLPKQAESYVYRKLVHFLRDQVGEIDANNVNIRAQADLNSAIIGQLNKMTKVKIIETLDEWYRIEPVEGVYGWVLEDFIDFYSDQVAPPLIVKMPTRNIYEIKKKKEEEERKKEKERLAQEDASKVKIKGSVVSLKSQTSAPNIRHQIMSDDGTIYYLMAYRSVLDGFLDHRVQIEGLPQTKIKLEHPVLLVTKVSLVL